MQTAPGRASGYIMKVSVRDFHVDQLFDYFNKFILDLDLHE